MNLYIRNAPNATVAMVLGRQLEHNKYLQKHMIEDWGSKKKEVMLKGLRHKFFGPLAEKLLSTGNAVLHEDNPEDPYWGIGDGTGESWLGKLLMQVRDEIHSLINDPLSQELIKKGAEECHDPSEKGTSRTTTNTPKGKGDSIQMSGEVQDFPDGYSQLIVGLGTDEGLYPQRPGKDVRGLASLQSSPRTPTSQSLESKVRIQE